ncbi:MAG: hypothetical protein HRT98_02995 [Mycoplasmatales bacterium]|nr:hypothetical protein [Mycoplasmatales bacterium]
MKIKKAFLGASLITISTTAPIAVAISCGKDDVLNGVSKWRTSLKVGQEYDMEDQKSERTTSLPFGLTPKIAEMTVKLQMWLEGHGFTLFSNSTSIFDTILSNIPIQATTEYDELSQKNNRTPDEEVKFQELKTEIEKWSNVKKKELQNRNKWKLQDLYWTSNNKVVLDGWKRRYQITKIKDTNQGVAIQTTLNTPPPKNGDKIDGYIVRDPLSGKVFVNSNVKSVSIDGETEDLEGIWNKIHNPNHSNIGTKINEKTFINEYTIMKRFVGVKLSNHIIDFKDKGGKTIKQKFEDVLKSLASINPKEFKENVRRFQKVEEYFHNTVMNYIKDNEHDITKIFSNNSFTYTPQSIIKDLQAKAQKNPKLLGNVNPKNLTWIK